MLDVLIQTMTLDEVLRIAAAAESLPAPQRTPYARAGSTVPSSPHARAK